MAIKRKSMLITGPSGSGKNYILEQHANRGARTFDLDKLGKKVVTHHISDRSVDGVTRWIVDPVDVKVKLNEAYAESLKVGYHPRTLRPFQSSTPYIVCCGTSSNIDEIAPLFDIIQILRISPATYNRVARAKKKHYESTGKVAPDGWWKEDGGEHWLKKRDAILAACPEGSVSFLDNDRASEARGAFHQNG